MYVHCEIKQGYHYIVGGSRMVAELLFDCRSLREVPSTICQLLQVGRLFPPGTRDCPLPHKNLPTRYSETLLKVAVLYAYTTNSYIGVFFATGNFR
jgi:hypothetical protein